MSRRKVFGPADIGLPPEFEKKRGGKDANRGFSCSKKSLETERFWRKTLCVLVKDTINGGETINANS